MTILNPHPTNEYHPPLTGLEAHFEEELAHEAHQPEPAVAQKSRFTVERSNATQTTTDMDRVVEEAMHLDL